MLVMRLISALLTRLPAKPAASGRRFLSCCLIYSLAALPMAGCQSRETARSEFENINKSADQGLNQIKPKPTPSAALTEESSPWFGDTAVLGQTGELLPSAMEDNNAVVLTFEKPLTLAQLAGRIQAATNLRVIVHAAAVNDTMGAATPVPTSPSEAGGNVEASDGTFLPADGLEVAGGRTVWQGKLSNLLDQISDRFDAEWKYSDNAIHISQQVVRTFMLHALAGSTDVGGSVKTGETGASGGLPQQSVDSTSKLVVWEEIQKAIETIIGNKARASYSPATGTVTVAGSPSAVSATEQYLRLQNKMRLRRVSLEAKVLSVQLSKAYNNNFDLDLVIRNSFGGNQPFVFSSAKASGTDVGRTIQAGVLRAVPDALGGNKSSAQVVINALDAVSNHVAVEYSGSLVTLSDQPAPLQVATKRSYVARVSGSSTADGAASTTLEPGTIDIGLSMNLLPRVIEQDRIMLRIALGITDLVQLREFSSGGSSLQLPEIDTTGFLQNAVLRSGETLVLAGFEKKSANDTQNGVGHPANWLMGGGEKYGNGREIRILLITAQVMPEEPLSVLQP